MQWIGLTGSIGAGKSTVAGMLRKAGYTVVDADSIAHEGLRSGTSTYQAIVDKLGIKILTSDGEIDRRKLGQLIFADNSQRAWLEGLLHPMVQSRVKEIRTELESSGETLAFYEVPLLFEKGLEKQFDQIMVIWAPESIQIPRLMSRNGWTAEEVAQRSKLLLPMAEKIKRADFSIENSGTIAELQLRIEQVLKILKN
jgi:dephospho-CoA kinase